MLKKAVAIQHHKGKEKDKAIANLTCAMQALRQQLSHAQQVRVDVEHASHSKREGTAHFSKLLSPALDLQCGHGVCGSCPKERARLAGTTPTAHY